MQSRIFLSILCFFGVLGHVQYATCQEIITGKVLNLYSKLPVENVAVSVFKGTSTAITNDHGFFQMTLNKEDSLVFTHPDYKSGGVKLPDANVFVIYIEQYNYYPSYIEGELSLYTYLEENLKIPRKARLVGIDGWLYIEVMIDSSGSIVSCQALNELCANCEKDIVEVIQNIPGKWTKSDIPINKRLIFPFEFRLSHQQKEVKPPDLTVKEGKVMRTMTFGVADES